MNVDKIIQIQSWFRGCLCRHHRFPNIMYSVQKYLQKQKILLSKITQDGRINSFIHEDVIIKLLQYKYEKRIQKPNKRMWYDILLFDYKYGWLPVNIKSSTLNTNDNTANLTMCIYVYTNYNINFSQTYKNGFMSKILVEKIKNKEYNNTKRDYYFLVINKNDTCEIIINSVKGLSILCPNLNNLPFQVCWKNNKQYSYKSIDKVVDKFIKCFRNSRVLWKESFIQDMKSL